jgi:hypothetical protein
LSLPLVESKSKQGFILQMKMTTNGFLYLFRSQDMLPTLLECRDSGS